MSVNIGVTGISLTSALGAGWEAHRRALRSGASGLRANSVAGSGGLGWIGEVTGLDQALPAELARFDCRNNRLAYQALLQDDFLPSARALVRRHGGARVGVFVGTSTSGIAQTERAFAQSTTELPDWFDYRHTHNVYSLGAFLGELLQTSGISVCISTACSSSAKVFAAAARAMRLGLCDAAIVGGCDSLCLTTLCGFQSLQLVSPDPCRPADASRNGISIGEGAGFALLEFVADTPRALLGYGESSDAYHMSSPDPGGAGAASSMRQALARAALAPAAIGYVNLHGTATPANDRAEDAAVVGVLGGQVPCSSTKGATGHTLGAAGIIEAGIALLALDDGWLPASVNTALKDPTFGSNILLEPVHRPVTAVMSNSFGFGGSNCSLVLGHSR